MLREPKIMSLKTTQKKQQECDENIGWTVVFNNYKGIQGDEGR